MQRLVMLLIVLSMTCAANAMFMSPTDAPVDRLVKNAEAYIKEHPDDAQGYYVLGRIHYLAWSIGTGKVPAFGEERDGQLPAVASRMFVRWRFQRARWEEGERRAKTEMKVIDETKLSTEDREALHKRMLEIFRQLNQENWMPPRENNAELKQHAKAAVARFRKAIELKGDNGLYRLGLASLCEQYAPDAEQAKQPYMAETADLTEEQAFHQWRQAAMEQYRKAFELTEKEDARLKERPIVGIDSLISYESTQGYLRVVKRMAMQDVDVKLIARMQAHQKKIEELPSGGITPIVFSLHSVDSLNALIDESASVAFDLDGTGRAQRWTWVKAGTDVALLVWDPSGGGEIRSGRQLFGSVTWWLLPGDGYRALDLLDDNRDGELTGDELRGLAAWFDRNADGVSEPGEVVPLSQLPIAGLGVKATSHEGDCMMNPLGLRLTDGTLLPTWDWLAKKR